MTFIRIQDPDPDQNEMDASQWFLDPKYSVNDHYT